MEHRRESALFGGSTCKTRVQAADEAVGAGAVVDRGATQLALHTSGGARKCRHKSRPHLCGFPVVIQQMPEPQV